ncbi:MAG: hypothetical protein PHD01_13795 [Geobacteraceae bacterium]|nr:hypothetical protein [Geobacteraceae bacterium]
MKRFLSIAALFAFVAVSVFFVTGTARADEIKMVGVITVIDMVGKDAKTATVTLKDNDTGKDVVVIINDELTLDKLKDHRIVLDDEIRCKYEVIDGKNVSSYFRKTAGC